MNVFRYVLGSLLLLLAVARFAHPLWPEHDAHELSNLWSAVIGFVGLLVVPPTEQLIRHWWPEIEERLPTWRRE